MTDPGRLDALAQQIQELIAKWKADEEHYMAEARTLAARAAYESAAYAEGRSYASKQHADQLAAVLRERPADPSGVEGADGRPRVPPQRYAIRSVLRQTLYNGDVADMLVEEHPDGPWVKWSDTPLPAQAGDAIPQEEPNA